MVNRAVNLILTAREKPIHLKVKAHISPAACSDLMLPSIHRVEFNKIGHPQLQHTGEIAKIVPEIRGYF